jgi:hypothetical protein
MKIPFTINEYAGQKVIFINNEVFDWAIDEDALIQANEFASNTNALKAIHFDIKNYFLECLEDYIGFKLNMKQVNEAIKLGYVQND